jgi:RimJ/RimL family protein N-acetyltransferase
MPASQPPQIPRKDVRIDAAHYLIRTVTPADASDRWAGWMSDPGARHMLNLGDRSWSKADVANYIKTFDQRSVLLLGIFAKESGAHIGILTVDINIVTGQFLVNFLIGEGDYRDKGVIASVALPFREYCFETLGLKVAMASVLRRNSAMVRYLIRSGWTLDKTLRGSAKSKADGSPLDICLFSLSRDAWRDWKKRKLAEVTARA